MDNEYNLSSTEDSLNNKLIEISDRIEESIANLKDDFDKIGVTGDVWTGNGANVAKETFDELITKYNSFVEINREYVGYLDKK